MSLSVYLLGTPRFEQFAEPIQVGRRRVMALAAYLCLSDARQSRELLANLFWPDHDRASTLKSLRRELARLRKALGDDLVVADRLHLGLNPDADVWIDVTQFRAHLDAAETHDHTSQPCAFCQEKLAAAVALYSGDFMEGFHLAGCPDFERWQQYQRNSLRQRLSQALQRLVRLFEEQGLHERAIPYAQRWLWLEPLHEPAYRLLMRLYAQTGQQARVRKQYEECIQVLEEALGMPPSAETVRLYEELGGHVVKEEHRSIAPVVEGEAEQAAHTIPMQLPREPTPFVGRERELSILLLRLREPGCRLLTLVGPGGIGKTRMAIEAARQLAAQPSARVADGIFFVSLSQVDSVKDAAPTIMKTLGHPPGGNARPEEELLDLLRDKKTLLVLDNLEHLPPVGRLVANILAEAPHVTILATSREALSLQEEWFHPVGGMSIPPSYLHEASEVSLQEYDAVQLFAQAAQRARLDFSLPAEARDVVRICQLVQGMPLALVLAASWRELLSSQEIADELERSLDILEGDARNLPPRQRSVRAAFDYSWRRLSADDQQVFRKLSVFRGGFTRDSARAVSGAGLRVLRTLVKKSFVSPTADDRYGIHELLRQFGVEKLVEAGESLTTRAAHSHYFMDLLQASTRALKGQRQLQALRDIGAEVENVRTAWHWAVRQRNEERIAQALESVYLFFDMKGRHYEGAQFLRPAREALAPIPGTPPGRVWGRLLALVALFEAHFASKHDKLAAAIEQALAVARTSGDEAEIGFALFVQGEFVGLVERKMREAAKIMEESLSYFQAVNDPHYVAYIYLWLGQCYAQLEGPHSHDTYTRKGLRLARDTGNVVMASNALALLADAAFAAGEYEEAEAYAQESFEIGSELGLRGCMAHTQAQLALGRVLRGETAQAAVIANSGLRLAQEIRYGTSSAYASAVLGVAAAVAENYELGARFSEQSLEAHAGSFARLLGHWARAVNAAGAETGDDILKHLREAADCARFLGRQAPTAWLLPPLAVVVAQREAPAEAVQLLSLASTQLGGASAWFEKWPLLQRLRADLKAELGRECFEAAWLQGRGLSLEEALEKWLPPAP